MSRRERDRGQVDPVTLRRRRWLLGAHLALEALCLVGAFGPWWQATAGGAPFGGPYCGHDAATNAFDGAAVVAGLGCLVAFFFASYDLVADADLQLPVLLASLCVAGAAATVFYRAHHDPSTLDAIVDEVVRAGTARDLATAGDGGGAAAAVTTAAAAAPADPLLRLAPGIRYRWGLALLVSAAPLLVLVSVVLTFALRRAPEPP